MQSECETSLPRANMDALHSEALSPRASVGMAQSTTYPEPRGETERSHALFWLLGKKNGTSRHHASGESP